MEDLAPNTTFCWSCHNWFALDAIDQLFLITRDHEREQFVGRFCHHCGPAAHDYLMALPSADTLVWKSM
jgi:hypothetical protein